MEPLQDLAVVRARKVQSGKAMVRERLVVVMFERPQGKCSGVLQRTGLQAFGRALREGVCFARRACSGLRVRQPARQRTLHQGTQQRSEHQAAARAPFAIVRAHHVCHASRYRLSMPRVNPISSRNGEASMRARMPSRRAASPAGSFASFTAAET